MINFLLFGINNPKLNWYVKMKISHTLMLIGLALPFTVQAQSIQDWEKCADKVGSTLNVLEIGNIGYEQEIKIRCGERPSTTISKDKLVNSLASDVIKASQWKSRFQKLTLKDYAAVQASLTVSGPMQREGDWLVGSGYDPKGAGSEQAIIAVNTRNNKVMAAYVSAGVLHTYGFDENSKDVPEKFWQWMLGKTAAG